jgi:Zn finger protein HypA/HybF involved in hydrogenase expression
MKRKFWCQTCAKKYMLDTKDDVNGRIIQAKLPFIDYDSNAKKTKSQFYKHQGKVKCKICGFILTEIENEQSTYDS